MIPFDDLPVDWQQKVQELRTECAKYRVERNKARAELVALKAEIGR